ncbi:maleylpyruvate isomerase family mycothiol-dependent enzyme [Bailinhaonella thermotolerans]|uniref:Maleylpyruvate isomerase family mycothiol-dependent enzyme n=1 Tax=Bailinhaonella thermotolerans TaxID=1070861 RepID=A0A3A4AVD0_9ACTN|nr:maleylpyruvate isomerase family mycothiol-dependent enzyme [Bailinhaonella thermotolerans]RJL34190.1 maleylpyruvate isomerase family mycothiol-dependent enzyme [Bailinhaonella thermotolerans]
MNPDWDLYLDAMTEGGEMPRPRRRADVLAAALARRPAAARVPRYAAPYAARVSALDALLGALGEDDHRRVAVEGWTVQELVVHLLATDGLLARAVGAPAADPPSGTEDAVARTVELIRAERGRPPGETRSRWREQARALCAHLCEAGEEAAGRRVSAGGLRMRLGDHLTQRAFETWIHTDDIGRVMGLPVPLPVPEHLNPMAGLVARGLRLVAPRPGRLLRLELTGPGGGVWDVPLSRGAPPPGRVPDAVIVTDVAEFCFLVSGRRDPASFEAVLSGDTELAREVLAAAPALSGP